MNALDATPTASNISPSTANDDYPDDRILNERDRAKFTSLGRTAWYYLRKRGDAPAPIQLTPGRLGYRVGDLRAWLASRRRVTAHKAA